MWSYRSAVLNQVPKWEARHLILTSLSGPSARAIFPLLCECVGGTPFIARFRFQEAIRCDHVNAFGALM